MPQLNFEATKNKSSRILRMAYHAESTTAVVEFPDNVQYHYNSMSCADYEAWRDADSAGSYLYKTIGKNFPYHKTGSSPDVCDLCAEELAEELELLDDAEDAEYAEVTDNALEDGQ